MSNEKPILKKQYWFPILGYYLNYFALAHSDRDRFWITLNSLFLIAFFGQAFLVPYTTKIPADIAYSYTILATEIFLLLVIAITFIETAIVTRSKNPNNKVFQRLHWDRLAGKSRRFVLITFLFFNYQEMSIAIVGTAFTFISHTLF